MTNYIKHTTHKSILEAYPELVDNPTSATFTYHSSQEENHRLEISVRPPVRDTDSWQIPVSVRAIDEENNRRYQRGVWYLHTKSLKNLALEDSDFAVWCDNNLRHYEHQRAITDKNRWVIGYEVISRYNYADGYQVIKPKLQKFVRECLWTPPKARKANRSNGSARNIQYTAYGVNNKTIVGLKGTLAKLRALLEQHEADTWLINPEGTFTAYCLDEDANERQRDGILYNTRDTWNTKPQSAFDLANQVATIGREWRVELDRRNHVYDFELEVLPA